MSKANVASSTPCFKNEAHISGTLAKDPVTKYRETGKCVATLNVITKHGQYTEFHRVVLWEKLAEKVAELKKGAFLRVVGRLQTRSWDDKQTGQKKYITELLGSKLRFQNRNRRPKQCPTARRLPNQFFRLSSPTRETFTGCQSTMTISRSDAVEQIERALLGSILLENSIWPQTENAKR